MATASSDDLLKIFRLLSAKEAVNHQLAVSLLESLDLFEDVAKSLVYRLAAIPFQQRGIAFAKVLAWGEHLFSYRTKSSSRDFRYINKYDFTHAHPAWKLDLCKIQFRANGGKKAEIFEHGTTADQLELAQFCLAMSKQVGGGMEMYPFNDEMLEQMDLNGLKELWFNPKYLPNYPIERALNTAIETINISDFPSVQLTSQQLIKLKGRTLKMRRGYYHRHKKLLDNFPEVKIEIDESNIHTLMNYKGRYAHALSPRQVTKIAVDKSIIQGKYLSSILKSSTSFFPNEFEEIDNLELILIPHARLRSIPLRLLRMKKLKYLVLASKLKRPRIKIGLEKHPTLKAILFLPIKQLIGLNYRQISEDELKEFEVLEMSRLPQMLDTKGSRYFADIDWWKPADENFQGVIDEVVFLTKYPSLPTPRMSEHLAHNNFPKPAPIFENVKNENDIFSDEAFVDLLRYFGLNGLTKSAENDLQKQKRNNGAQDLPF